MKNNFFIFIVIIFFAITAYIVFFGQYGKAPNNQEIVENNNYVIKYITIAERKVKVDLATTPEAHAQGLSGRKELKENEGMLFVFDKPGKYSFWMKDMNFPIDIIWVSEDFKVVYIKKDARPELYPETYAPKDNAKYVLEVVSGFSDKNNLKEGGMVSLSF